jgi:integrase
MTHLLISYARLEIEAADRLRATTGPRTRMAAQAALAVEVELRASLREAILCCDHTPAVDPVKLTAERLGIDLDASEDDYAILCDKMLRMQIEISEERERRANGYFADKQPYLDLALSTLHATPTAHTTSIADSPAPTVAAADNTPEIVAALPAPSAEQMASSTTSVNGPALSAAESTDDLLLDQDGVTVRYRATLEAPESQERILCSPRLLDLWNAWFEHGRKGAIHSSNYDITDAALGMRFEKNADTLESTRRILADVFGNRPIDEITEKDWLAFNYLLHRLPKGHGKSRADKSLSYREIVANADAKQRRQISAANKKIASHTLESDEKEDLLRRAKIERLSPRTVQRHERTLSKVLDYAVFSKQLSANPYKAFVMTDAVLNKLLGVREDTSRLLWHDEFQKMLATEKWNSNKTAIDDPVYWVPLIARLGGMRSEEILQLKPSDVRSDAGIWYFIVRQGTGQSVKSARNDRSIMTCRIAKWLLRVSGAAQQARQPQGQRRKGQQQCHAHQLGQEEREDTAEGRAHRHVLRQRRDDEDIHPDRRRD